MIITKHYSKENIDAMNRFIELKKSDGFILIHKSEFFSLNHGEYINKFQMMESKNKVKAIGIISKITKKETLKNYRTNKGLIKELHTLKNIIKDI